MDADKQVVREFSSFVKSITLTLFIVHNAFTLKQELALFKVEVIPCDRKKSRMQKWNDHQHKWCAFSLSILPSGVTSEFITARGVDIIHFVGILSIPIVDLPE